MAERSIEGEGGLPEAIIVAAVESGDLNTAERWVENVGSEAVAQVVAARQVSVRLETGRVLEEIAEGDKPMVREVLVRLEILALMNERRTLLDKAVGEYLALSPSGDVAEVLKRFNSAREKLGGGIKVLREWIEAHDRWGLAKVSPDARHNVLATFYGH